MLLLGTWHLLHHPLHRHVQEGGPPHGQLRRAAPGGAHQGLRHRHRGRRGLLQGLQPNHGQLISNPCRVLLLSSRRHKQMRLTLTDELPVHIVEQVVGWQYFWEYLLHRSVFC